MRDAPGRPLLEGHQSGYVRARVAKLVRAGSVSCLLLLLVAGCAGTSNDGASSTTVTITNPNDYGYVENETNGSTAHLHDYWGGKDVLEVLNVTVSQTGPGYSGGPAVAATFRPETDRVVPQGTSSVFIAFDVERDGLDRFGDVEVWVKTAADANTTKVYEATFEGGSGTDFGAGFEMRLTNAQNDLPHQRLSAWIIELRMTPDDLGVLRYKGTTTMTVTAHRGLDIPLYPGHPDLWKGANVLPILEASGSDLYLSDPGDGGCDGIDCAEVLVPPVGVIVPEDTRIVEVTLTQGPSPTTLGFSYHGADSRELRRIEPDTTGATQTYTIDAVGAGDGPYSTTSLWEFVLYIDGPLEDGLVVQDYHITVVAKKTLGGA